jgi:hypothetical protein
LAPGGAQARNIDERLDAFSANLIIGTYAEDKDQQQQQHQQQHHQQQMQQQQEQQQLLVSMLKPFWQIDIECLFVPVEHFQADRYLWIKQEKAWVRQHLGPPTRACSRPYL